MSGWTAMAGTHQFVAPGEERAGELARALAAHGFALVTGRYWSGRWLVTAIDDGPYTVDDLGHRTFAAAGRPAGARTRPCRGRSHRPVRVVVGAVGHAAARAR